MPNSLPIRSTTRRQSSGVIRRASLQRLLTAVTSFTALPADMAAWLRCYHFVPAFTPGDHHHDRHRLGDRLPHARRRI